MCFFEPRNEPKITFAPKILLCCHVISHMRRRYSALSLTSSARSVLWNIARHAWNFPMLYFARISGVYIFMCRACFIEYWYGLHWFFVSLSLILVPHCGNKPNPTGHVWHVKQVNLPAPDSTVYSLHLLVAASTWDDWKRNTVDDWFALLPPASFALSSTKKSLSNRALITLLRHIGVIQVQLSLFHDSAFYILPKTTTSLPIISLKR